MWYVYVYLCVSVCVVFVYRSRCTTAEVHSFLLPLVWGIELRSSGLHSNTFKHWVFMPDHTLCNIIFTYSFWQSRSRRQPLKRCLMFIKLIFACLANSMELRNPYRLTEKHVCVSTYFKGYKFKFSDLDVCVLDFFFLFF